MSYGLRVWDAAGNLTLDISDETAFIMGVITGNLTPNSFRDHTITGITSTNSVWATALQPDDGYQFDVVISNNNVRVTNIDNNSFNPFYSIVVMRVGVT